MEELSRIVSVLSMIKGLYDFIRIVDPVNKKVILCKGSNMVYLKDSCHNFWNKGTACENCVSARAYNLDETYIKLEYNKDNMFLVTASPVDIDGKRYIIEIIKDITSTGIISDLEKRSVSEINYEIRKMNESIVRDALTNIYNKRYIKEKLPVEICSCIANNKPLSIIITDIDLFKNVNDAYGHQAGDFVLKEYVKLLSDATRRSQDWIARYGGEEFLIVLKNTKADLAYSIAERIRKKLENKEFIYKESVIKITASFGVSSLSDEITNADELINEADKNLYRAKREGRNKTAI